MNKKRYNYSLSPEVEQMLEIASKDLYRSKSSIVQEALLSWLRHRNYDKRYKEKEDTDE